MTYILKTEVSDISPGILFTAIAPQLKGETRIRSGNTVYIWFFESPRNGPSGAGLVARGVIEAVETIYDSKNLRLNIRVSERISRSGFGIQQLMENIAGFGPLERKIRGYSHKQIRSITEQEASLLSQSFA